MRLLTHAPVGKRFGMGGPRSRRRSPGAASNLLFGHVDDAHGPGLADARKDRRGVPFHFGLEQNRGYPRFCFDLHHVRRTASSNSPIRRTARA